ncbi:hypothetical protein Aduo_011252 [Ancylostoma duodenale]
MNWIYFVALTTMLQTSTSMMLGKGGFFGGFQAGRGGGARRFYGGRNLLGRSFMGGGLGGGLWGGSGACCPCCPCCPCPCPCPSPCPPPCMPLCPPCPPPCLPPLPLFPPPCLPPLCCICCPSAVMDGTTEPVGVPDIVCGPCGEAVIPLFNSPLRPQPLLPASTLAPLTTSAPVLGK